MQDKKMPGKTINAVQKDSMDLSTDIYLEASNLNKWNWLLSKQA